MTAKSETAITNAIIDWIKEQGGDGFHIHGSMYQRSGEPDIDGWIPTSNGVQHLKLEVKTPTGKPSKLQLVRLDRYVKACYTAGIVTNIDECKHLVYEFSVYGNNKQSWERTKSCYVKSPATGKRRTK